jgi:hypothetical protein
MSDIAERIEADKAIYPASIADCVGSPDRKMD